MKLLLDDHLWPGLLGMVSNLVPEHDLESVHSFDDGGALVNQVSAVTSKCTTCGHFKVHHL
jgi:hypothetical protein